MKKNFYLFTVIACIIYIVNVVIGGILTPGYSHLNNAISEIEVLIGDNYRLIITTLFVIYNALVLLYGLSLFKYNSKSTMKKVQSLSIAVIGLSGLLLYFFPADIVGTEITFRGTIHIVLVSVIAPLTMLISILGHWIYKDSKNTGCFSMLMFVIILVFGGITAYLASNGVSSNFGIFERITIGSYLLWLFITSLYERKNINEQTI